MPRDITAKQFNSAIAKRGIERAPAGYFHIGNKRYVYARNGGNKRRSQLAYLIAEQRKIMDKKCTQ